MDKAEAQARANAWDMIGHRLSAMADSQWDDINDWLADAARVAQSRGQEAWAMSRALPEGDSER